MNVEVWGLLLPPIAAVIGFCIWLTVLALNEKEQIDYEER